MSRSERNRQIWRWLSPILPRVMHDLDPIIDLEASRFARVLHAADEVARDPFTRECLGDFGIEHDRSDFALRRGISWPFHEIDQDFRGMSERSSLPRVESRLLPALDEACATEGSIVR